MTSMKRVPIQPLPVDSPPPPPPSVTPPLTSMQPEERFNEIHSQLLDLEQYRRRMRAHEPKHSDPEHDCMECEILGTLDVLRRTSESRTEAK